MGQIAHLLEIGHLVPDRRRGDPHIVVLRERPRSDRLGGVDEVGNDRLQDSQFSFV